MQPMSTNDAILDGTPFLLESMFIDQATLNGTRPNSPAGVEPAMIPSGCSVSGSIPCIGPTPEDLSVSGLVRWPSSAPVNEMLGWLTSTSSAAGMAFQSLVDAMSSVDK
jgi:hypothetical protein